MTHPCTCSTESSLRSRCVAWPPGASISSPASNRFRPWRPAMPPGFCKRAFSAAPDFASRNYTDRGRTKEVKVENCVGIDVEKKFWPYALIGPANRKPVAEIRRFDTNVKELRTKRDIGLDWVTSERVNGAIRSS